MCNRNPFLYGTKDYLHSPIGYMLSYPDSATSEPYSSPGYSSSSSSVSNTSSASVTPEPENNPADVSTVAGKSLTAVAANKSTMPKKQYQCTQCLKNFSRPSALQTHSYTHTAEKPFQCLSPGCGRRFSVVSNLRRHFKVHQKPSVGNKLSSEDRLRYVRQLIKSSDAILARQQQEQTNSVESSSHQYNEACNDPEITNEYSSSSPHYQPEQQDSSIYRYQHYLLLPSINNNNSNTVNNNNFASIINHGINSIATPVEQHHNNNYLTGSDMAELTYSCWPNNQLNSVEHTVGVAHHHFNNHHQYPPLVNINVTSTAFSITATNQQESFSLYNTYMNYNNRNNNETDKF